MVEAPAEGTRAADGAGELFAALGGEGAGCVGSLRGGGSGDGVANEEELHGSAAPGLGSAVCPTFVKFRPQGRDLLVVAAGRGCLLA